MATKAPRQVTVVQPAPSQDGSPTFASYSVLETSRNPDAADQRPPFGLVIYDTATGANATRAERMARVTCDRTMTERRRAENDQDRIEVVALTPPCVAQRGTTSTESDLLTPGDRAEAGIRHFEQERNSRLAIADLADAKSWFPSERVDDGRYAWGIILIDRLKERWEEALGYLEDHPDEDSHTSIVLEENALSSPFGSFVRVYWQPREEMWERWEEPVTPESRVWLNRMKLELLGRMPGAEGLLQSVSGFYGHFLPEGILDRDLEVARRRT